MNLVPLPGSYLPKMEAVALWMGDKRLALPLGLDDGAVIASHGGHNALAAKGVMG